MISYIFVNKPFTQGRTDWFKVLNGVVIGLAWEPLQGRIQTDLHDLRMSVKCLEMDL